MTSADSTDSEDKKSEDDCSLSDHDLERVPDTSDDRDVLFLSVCEQTERERLEKEKKEQDENLEDLSNIASHYVVYMLRRERDFLDVRNEILKSDNNNLFRDYMKELTGRKKFEKENWDLEKTIDWYKKNFVPNEEILKTLEEIKKLKARELTLVTRVMTAEADAEKKEELLEIFEKYFGGRNKLYELNAAIEKCVEKDRKCRKNYGCVDALIADHTKADCPQTLGQRVVKCIERVTDCYIGMLRGIYRRLMGTDYKERKNSK